MPIGFSLPDFGKQYSPDYAAAMGRGMDVGHKPAKQSQELLQSMLANKISGVNAKYADQIAQALVAFDNAANFSEANEGIGIYQIREATHQHIRVFELLWLAQTIEEWFHVFALQLGIEHLAEFPHSFSWIQVWIYLYVLAHPGNM